MILFYFIFFISDSAEKRERFTQTLVSQHRPHGGHLAFARGEVDLQSDILVLPTLLHDLLPERVLAATHHARPGRPEPVRRRDPTLPHPRRPADLEPRGEVAVRERPRVAVLADGAVPAPPGGGGPEGQGGPARLAAVRVRLLAVSRPVQRGQRVDVPGRRQQQAARDLVPDRLAHLPADRDGGSPGADPGVGQGGDRLQGRPGRGRGHGQGRVARRQPPAGLVPGAR